MTADRRLGHRAPERLFRDRVAVIAVPVFLLKLLVLFKRGDDRWVERRVSLKRDRDRIGRVATRKIALQCGRRTKHEIDIELTAIFTADACDDAA